MNVTNAFVAIAQHIEDQRGRIQQLEGDTDQMFMAKKHAEMKVRLRKLQDELVERRSDISDALDYILKGDDFPDDIIESRFITGTLPEDVIRSKYKTEGVRIQYDTLTTLLEYEDDHLEWHELGDVCYD